MYTAGDPETITEEKVNFAQVSDEVDALCWIPDSGTDLLAATKDNLFICDTRASWTSQHQIEEYSHKGIFGIKFDPFDKNRFATISKDSVRIYDKRISTPQYVLCKFHDSEFLGFDWSQYCQSLLATYS